MGIRHLPIESLSRYLAGPESEYELNRHTMDFNSILAKIGDFGYYQKLILAFIVLPSSLLYVLVFYTQLFILFAPPHTCASNNLNLTFPPEADLSCSHYEPVYNGSLITSWNISSCDAGWDYDFSSYFPTIVSENNWVCHNKEIPYYIQSFYYLGSLIGAFIFGHISDTYGRKPSILIGCAVCGLAGFSTAFVESLYLLILLRMLVGGSSMPLLEDCYIISIEYLGKKFRTYPLVVLAIGYGIFPAAYPFFPKFVRDWRLICVISSIPLGAVLLLYRLLPESACWLLAKGRTEEAVHYLRIAAKFNGNNLPEQLSILNDSEEDDSQDLPPPETPLLSLFKTPRLKRNTIMLALIWFMTVSCYTAIIQNTSNLGTDVYYSYVYGGLIELPSVPWMFFTVDSIGRRWTMLISTFVGFIGGMFSLLFANDTSVALLVISLILRIALTSQYSVMAQYSAEVYPTVIRSRAVALLNIIGTSGLLFSPYIVFLALSWPYLPLFLSGLLCLLICIMTFFLPETLNHHLPHTMLEGENFGRGQKLLSFPCLH